MFGLPTVPHHVQDRHQFIFVRVHSGSINQRPINLAILSQVLKFNLDNYSVITASVVK
ncbi:hypothetical protein Hanom_Chr12g01122561 [Helianthus anomalus]